MEEVQSDKKRANGIWVKRWLSLIATTIALIPTWLYLIVRALLEPNGFWQELVLFGLGVWALWFFQFLLIAGLCYFLFILWIT